MTNVDKLNQIFGLLRIEAKCKDYHQLKRAISYDIELSAAGRIKNVEKVLNEITMMLKVPSKPTLQILAEEGILRLEYVLPNKERIDLFDLGPKSQRPGGRLQCLLGETPRGDQVWFDMTEAPHLLIAGTTGSGKSTLLHSLIANLLLYQDVMIDIIDPKSVEFSSYQMFPQIRISNTYEQAVNVVNELYDEMEERYSLMRSTKQAPQKFPYHLLIVDEFADLIMQDHNDTLKETVCRLAQKSRSAGIHLALATQRPSASILDGNIKANFPARLACKVASGIDSRIILDQNGAEKLNGRGDAILKTSNNDIVRFQSVYCDPTITSSYLHASN